jgi:hypothetical protein
VADGPSGSHEIEHTVVTIAVDSGMKYLSTALYSGA